MESESNIDPRNPIGELPRTFSKNGEHDQGESLINKYGLRVKMLHHFLYECFISTYQSKGAEIWIQCVILI